MKGDRLRGGTINEPVVKPSPEGEERQVELALRGETRAFEGLYRAHHGRVYSLAVRMAGVEWAEDLTQEVFIRAWEKLRTFRGRSSFGTWLYRLAVNLILSRRETLRRRDRRQVWGDEALERGPGLTPSQGLSLDLEAAIQRLPEGARQIFVLFDVEGYPHEEIAALMGISPGTSKSQLHRARMLLRGHLT
jgi:RNA polymerase sigma-70 factor (ECF subfamily)